MKGSQQLKFPFHVCGGHSSDIFGGIASLFEDAVGQLIDSSSGLPLKACGQW